MTIMLVDSDKENIKNFRTYIKSAFPQLKVAGSFSQPDKDILAAVEDINPNLIIADIKFFGGVRFMRFKEVHDRFPDIRMIIYGTYNDTEYMKRARDFGVLDYMYRPVKPNELARCLNLALSHFKKKSVQAENTRKLSARYKDELSHYETMFLRRLAEGHITNENEIAEALGYFELQLTPKFIAAVVHIDHFRQIALTLTESEKHMLILKILQAAKESLRASGVQAQVFMMTFHSVAVLLGGQDDSTTQATIELFEKVKQAVYEKAEVRVSIGIGRKYNNITDIPVSYREADAAFRYRNRVGYNTVIPLEFVEPGNHITYRYPSDREERLVYMAAVGDYEYCRQVLIELFDALAQGGNLPEGLLPKIIMNIVLRISRYLSEQNLAFASQAMRLFPTAEILAVRNLEEGLTVFDRALKSFCTFINEYENNVQNRLYEEAKRYCIHHFAETFSTSSVAVKLNTTPEYLSRVFTQKEGRPLFEYVMLLRIDTAKQLLAETTVNIEAIAGQVGFEDAKYFASLFRQHVGVLPEEYRSESKRA